MAIGNLKGLSQLAKAAQTKRGKEVLTVSVSDVISKDQVRKRFQDIEGLAETIASEGQQSPIIVSPADNEGKYTIQKGERRWRACQHAGIDTIDIIINEKEQSDLDHTAGELIENIQRDDLTPMEIAHALNVFVDNEWKQKDIAKRIGKNISYVSTHLSLLKLPEYVNALYEQEVTSDTETLNNLRLLHKTSPDACEKLCKQALKKGITRSQSRDALNAAKKIDDSSTKPAQHIDHDVVASSSDEQQWTSVNPDQVVVQVKVMVTDQLKQGILLTSRLSTKADTVWVELTGKGKPKIEVNVADVNIVGIKAR